MNYRLIGFFGLVSVLLFCSGFTGLFIINPQAIQEINNVCITYFNLLDMEGRLWISSLGYIASGVAGIIYFGALLFKVVSTSRKIALWILVLHSVLWISFGVIPYNHLSDSSNLLMLNRTLIDLFLILSGLLIISSEGLTSDHLGPIRLSSIVSASLIGILCFMSVFVFNDSTWIRSNLCYLIYHLWIGVSGLTLLIRRTPNIA